MCMDHFSYFRKETVEILAFFFFLSVNVKSYVFAFDSLPVSLKLCLKFTQGIR